MPKPDEFCADGKTKKLNKSRPYGVVYADGFEETKFVQDEICYRGDGIPVSYGKEIPNPMPIEAVLAENAELKRQLAALSQQPMVNLLSNTAPSPKKRGRPKKVVQESPVVRTPSSI